MKLRKTWMNSLLAAVLVAGCASVEQKTANLDAELDGITRWWAGQYRGSSILPGTERPVPIVHEIVSIQAPRFGDRAFVYQLRRDGADGAMLQQKIFSFDTDPLRERNSMRAWVLAPDQLDATLATMPSTWGALRPGQLMAFPDECAFRWRATKTGFVGTVSSVDCEFDGRAFGQRVRPDMSYGIDAKSLTWNETLSGEDGSVLATTDGPLRAERIGPVIDVRWSFYDVEGATIPEIRRELYAKSPIQAGGETRAARTDWTVSWDVEPTESETGCHPGEIAVTVEISNLLPRLVSRDSLPPESVDELDTYYAALLRHGLRHQRFALEAARQVEAVLSGLGERETCEALTEDAAMIVGDIIRSARRREQQFDETTRYGQAEGAELPRS